MSVHKVIVEQGVLGGFRRNTENYFEYYCYLLIPYAAPPVGELRFKSPQPPNPWQGERYITKVDYKNVSLQLHRTNKILGSEDCLYLNVYTPRLPTQDQGPCVLPVLVYIHGGGFTLGNGIMQQEKAPNLPDHLIEHDVVVVSINYRLGPFGFLSLDIPEAAGNMGLKDQVMALQWIQNNIASFGGDKNNVTVLGCSAGAASVQYHMLSPLSKNLFSKGIAQSGSALNHWATQDKLVDRSVLLAQTLGYQGPVSEVRVIHEYLMKQSPKDLLITALKLTSKYKAIDFGFVPTIEKDFKNGEAFLTERPYVLFKQGLFHKIPMITGFSECEAAVRILECPNVISKFKEEKKFSDILKCNLSSEQGSKLDFEFMKQYLEKDDFDIATEDFFSHYDFTAGIIKNSKIISSFGVPVYLYLFSFFGNISFFENCFGFKRKTRSVHYDDHGYVMGHDFDVKFGISEQDILIRRRLSKMWTDFAKTGNPTPAINNVIPFLWPAYNSEKQTYMVIDQEMQLKNRFQEKRIAIFEEIYENYC